MKITMKDSISHSLRYGGATMMAAAGFPQYLIALYGGWTKDSKSLHIYAQPSDALIEIVSQKMNELAKTNCTHHFIHNAMAVQQRNKVKK
jgi:hypothetical protein